MKKIWLIIVIGLIFPITTIAFSFHWKGEEDGKSQVHGSPSGREAPSREWSKLVDEYISFSAQDIFAAVEQYAQDPTAENTNKEEMKVFCEKLSLLKEEIIKSLDEDSDELKYKALVAINTCLLYDDEILERIVALLESEDPNIRGCSIEGIIKADYDNARELVEKVLLGDSDKNVRFAAAWALYRINDVRYADLLLKSVLNQDGIVSRTASCALERMDRETIESMIQDAMVTSESEQEKEILNRLLEQFEVSDRLNETIPVELQEQTP